MRCIAWASMSQSGRCRSRSGPDSLRGGTRCTGRTIRHRRTPSGERCVAITPVFESFRCWLCRKVQPGAFLLGKLRSGGDAILRPPRASARRRGFDHARIVLARSHQSRILAGERRDSRAGVLRLCSAGARWAESNAAVRSGSRVLPALTSRNSFFRTKPCGPRSRRRRELTGVPDEHLRRGGGTSRGGTESSLNDRRPVRVASIQAFVLLKQQSGVVTRRAPALAESCSVDVRASSPLCAIIVARDQPSGRAAPKELARGPAQEPQVAQLAGS